MKTGPHGYGGMELISLSASEDDTSSSCSSH